MVEKNYTIALCVVSIDSKSGRAKGQIVAELEDGLFQEPSPLTMKYKSVLLPQQNLKDGEICVWQIQHDIGSGPDVLKAVQKENSIPVEIVLLYQYNDFDANSRMDIRRVLKEGFKLPFYPTKGFMLAIGEDDRSYKALIVDNKCIYCDERDGLWHVTRLNEIIVHEVFIPKDKVRKIETHPAKKDGTVERYIYRELYADELYNSAMPFDLATPEEIAVAVLRKVKDVYSIGTRERKNAEIILKAFDSIDDSRMDELRKVLEVKYGTVHDERLNIFRQRVQDVLEANDKFNEVISLLVEKVPELYERFRDEAQKKWEQETIAIRESRLKELAELKENIDKLRSEKQDLEKEKAVLEQKLEQNRSDLDKMSEVADQVKEHMVEAVELASKQAEQLLSQVAVLKPFMSGSIASSFNEMDLYVRSAKPLGSERESLDIYELILYIEENLKAVGINDDIAMDGATLIVSAWKAGLAVLLLGGRTREIATAVSAAVSGYSPTIITVPLGYSRVCNLYKEIAKADNGVVLLEDCVGGMAEMSLMPILREWRYGIKNNKLSAELANKWLLLSSEGRDVLNHLPLELLNYAVILSFNPVLDFYRDPIYKLGDGLSALSDGSTGSIKRYNFPKGIIEFIQKMGLDTEYIVQRTELLSCVDKYGGSSPVKVLALFELMEMAKQKECKEDYEKMLADIGLSENEKNWLIKLLDGTVTNG